MEEWVFDFKIWISMKREDIEKKASEYSRQQVKPLEKINHTQVGLAMYANDIAVAFEAGAEWVQKESNLRDIRLDTIQCCEEYLAKFGTLDGVYEHYFADITEK